MEHPFALAAAVIAVCVVVGWATEDIKCWWNREERWWL